MLSNLTRKLCLNETLKYGVDGLLNEMKAQVYPFVFLCLHLDFSFTLFCLKVHRAPFWIFLRSFPWFWSDFPWTCDKEKICCTEVALSCWKPPCGILNALVRTPSCALLSPQTLCQTLQNYILSFTTLTLGENEEHRCLRHESVQHSSVLKEILQRLRRYILSAQTT